jgi:alpha-tubulin suppressor-like RCC1 family protein
MEVSAGGSHTCALLDNGTVRCWGLGIDGQLGYGNSTTIGDNETPGSVAPVDLGAGRSAIAISAGDVHTCALLENGTVRCWGEASSGQLGYGNTVDIGDGETPGSVGPVNLAGHSAVAIASGRLHTCVIFDNGAVRCWGLNSSGQLGYGHMNNIGDNETLGSEGVNDIDLGAGRKAVTIAAGAAHTCVVLDNGSVRCWGSGGSGSLGYGDTTSIGNNETPGSVGPVDLGVGRNALTVDTGEGLTCALLDNGWVRCWGGGSNGRLGYGNTNNIGDNEAPGVAGPVSLGVESVGRFAIAISGSNSHDCALLDNGTVRCWGDPSEGQLGYGNLNQIGDNETPGSVGPVDLGSGRTAASITTGFRHTCALIDNGTIRCWGSGDKGQLGNASMAEVGDNETPASAGPVEMGGRNAVAITSGSEFNCAIFDDGTVRCWGSALSGQLGYGNTNNIGDNELPSSAGPVDLGAGRTARSIDAGSDHVCALLDNGTVRCWGLNSNGQLGYGNTNNIGDNELPSSVGPVDMGVGRTAVAITAGVAHTCARLDNGTVRCWGRALTGEIGYGNTNNIGDNELASAVGTVDLGGHNAAAISADGRHTCAIHEDSTLRCWGNGERGALGYGNTNNIGDNELASAVGTVDIGANRYAVAVSGGTFHTCSQLDNGTVRCWGEATNGQLGYGNTVDIGDNETPATVGPVDFFDDSPTAVADSKTVSEDSGATSLDVLTNDVDADGGLAKSIAAKTDGTHSIVAITGGGTGLTYQPEAGYCGPDSFTYTLNGGSVASVSVTVTCVDDPPVAVNDSDSLAEDSLATAIDVLANDTDIDAGPKSVASKTEGAHGTVTITGGGTGLTYTPVANYCGADSFTYALNGGSTATVNVTVTCVDDAPVAVNDSATVDEDASATAIDVLANDTDIDAGPKSVASKTNGAHGTVAITGEGTGLTYAPDPNYCGADSFTYILNGGSTATVSVTVTCVDDPPVAVNDSDSLAEDSLATAIDVLANDTDIDAGPKSVASKTEGAHGTVTITGGGTGLTYTPVANYCGADSFTYTLNGGSTATVNVTVTCVDDAPVAVNDSATVGEDASATAIDVLTNDTDIDAGPKSVASKTNGAHGTVAITGEGTGLTYAPDPNYCGADSFTYTLNGGSTATVSVTITCVDDTPVAVDDAKTIGEDASATAIDVLANDTDIDAGPKSVASKTEGAHGAVAITGGGTGLTYQPATNYCGSDSFTYTLNGGSSATVSMTMTCVDDSPVAIADPATLAEDASATAIDVLANDTDIDAGPKSVASKTEGAHGAVTITGGGTGLTYSPEANYCGPDSFTYTLNGGSTATVNVMITCVDDVPVAVNDSAALPEDSSATVVDVIANDTDIDAGPKSVASKSNGAHGTVTIIGGGASLTYQPDPNYCGSDSFTYTLNGGSVATVSIMVTCTDSPPTAVNDSATLNEDASATAIDVLANDTDIDAGPKSVASRTEGAHGTVAITGGGTGLTYAPAANYCGPDSFTYTLNGGSSATVSITVTCVDDLPTAVNDSATLNEDASAAAIDVLSNDTDSDAGPKSVASKTNGAHGTVVITGGGTGLAYQPAANYCGPDSFTYTLNGSSSATVSIAVTCIDDAPVAVNDSDSLIEDSPATAIDVLVNDTDMDGGPKTITGRTNGSHGPVAIIGGGAGITYAPAANYCGSDSFTYTLSGGSSATVSITVTCVDDPPESKEETPPPGSGEDQNNTPPTSSAPIINVTPGVGVVSGRRHPRIAIKGIYAFFTLTCKLANKDCIGTVIITANIPSVSLGPTIDRVKLVRGKFRLGAGRSVLVRAKLTQVGREVLESKRSLRGVDAKMAVTDTSNGEKGEIQVNLVRRPKASLLPGGT